MIATALIHFLIQLFASKLTKIKEIYEPGSPQLTPPKLAYKRCNIEERQIEEIWVYDITAKKQTVCKEKKRTKRIYYFAGGSWHSPLTGDHFKFLGTLAQRLKELAAITFISYPLAPNSPAPVAFLKLSNLYSTLSKHLAFCEEDVCLAGDSSGANIALDLTMHCLSSDSSPASRTLEAPGSLLFISSTVDLLHEHPDIPEGERHDPIQSVALVRKTGSAWAGNWDQRSAILAHLGHWRM